MYGKIIFIIITYLFVPYVYCELRTNYTDGTLGDSYYDEIFQLLILHTNDMHARFEQTSQRSARCGAATLRNCYGGFGRVAHVVREARANQSTPNVLFVVAGDTFTGSARFSDYKPDIATDFINLLQPDVMSLGNHEFDYGVNEMIDFVKNIKCPTVCANIDIRNEPKLAPYPNLIKRSVVLNVNGHKIGIIGYLTNETKYISNPEQVEFTDEINELRKESERLDSEGVKMIIALGHSGFRIDKEIAKNVPLIDAVIGGHSNTFLYNGPAPDIEEPEGPYPTMIEQSASGKLVPVVQAYAFTKYVGKLFLEFNLTSGDIIRAYGNPVLLTHDVPQAPDALDLLSKYDSKPEPIVCKSRVVLSNLNCRTAECNIGNVITDAMIYYYITRHPTTPFWTDVPIAIMNGGTTRSSIEPTNGKEPDGTFSVLKSDLKAVLPFQDLLYYTVLTGREFFGVLQLSIKRYFEKHGAFLQFSGVHVTYNITDVDNPSVAAVKIRCGPCEIPKYEDLDMDRAYPILIYSFLRRGGDGYEIFKTKPVHKVTQMGDEPILVLDVLSNYLNKFSPIIAGIEERITFINGSQTIQDDFNDKTDSITYHKSSVPALQNNPHILIYLFVLVQFMYL